MEFRTRNYFQEKSCDNADDVIYKPRFVKGILNVGEVRNSRVTQSDATLQVTNSEIFIEFLLSSY